MADSALGLGMEKEKASNVSLRKSETFRKNMHRLGSLCIDPSRAALYDLFPSLTREIQYYTCSEAFTL